MFYTQEVYNNSGRKTPNDTATLIALTEAIGFEPHETQIMAQILTAYLETEIDNPGI